MTGPKPYRAGLLKGRLMIESVVPGCDSNGFSRMVAEIAGIYGLRVLEPDRMDSGKTGLRSPWGMDTRGDGFLFFTEDPDTDFATRLRSLVREKGGHWLSLPPDEDAVHTLAARARDWIYENGIVCLQISGDVPQAQRIVCRDVLKALFAMCLLRTRPERLQEALRTRIPDAEKNPYPDIASVIEDLEARLPLRDKVALARFDESLPMLVDSALAVYIMGHYLWPPNPELLADCAEKAGLPPERMEENTALPILLEALLVQLKKTCLLRVVPVNA